jgi:hypothetical protein
MNNLEVDRMIKELHAMVIELRRVADVVTGLVRDGSPFVDDEVKPVAMMSKHVED